MHEDDVGCRAVRICGVKARLSPCALNRIKSHIYWVTLPHGDNSTNSYRCHCATAQLSLRVPLRGTTIRIALT
jgi:hypothetical protein